MLQMYLRAFVSMCLCVCMCVAIFEQDRQVSEREMRARAKKKKPHCLGFWRRCHCSGRENIHIYTIVKFIASVLSWKLCVLVCYLRTIFLFRLVVVVVVVALTSPHYTLVHFQLPFFYTFAFFACVRVFSSLASPALLILALRQNGENVEWITNNYMKCCEMEHTFMHT